MFMNETLSNVESMIISRRGIGIQVLFDAQIDAAKTSLGKSEGLSIGDKAPDFLLLGTKGHKISLQEVLTRGPVILTFYRGGWCAFCNAALKNWQLALPEISAAGATLLAITPETKTVCQEFKSAAKLGYELLSDGDNRTSDAYGLTYEMPTMAKEMLIGMDINVGARNGNENWSVPVTATYVIGRDQRIKLADCGPDYRCRLDPGDAIAAI